jgi:hypothetical protein
MIDGKPKADDLEAVYEREFVDDLIERLIVAHRAYKAADKSQIEEAETERYHVLIDLSDFVANAVWRAP